jgi:hypothetical protein
MTVFERLLEKCLGNDLTETDLWIDGVFRELERFAPAETADAEPGDMMIGTDFAGRSF